MAAVAIALSAVGCGGHNAKAGKIKSVEQVAPSYDFRDSAATRDRIALENRLGLANNRLQSGDYAAAEQLVREVLKKTPDSVDALMFLGVIQQGQGNAVAGETYRRTTELAPQRGDVLNNYGAWLCANGQPAESLSWFDQALQDANYPPAPALANAGGCAIQAGQAERAVRDLRKALELDPVNAYALESMARYETGQKAYFEARAFIERRLAAAPATASVLQLAIQIEQGLGDKVAASRYQQRLVKEFPDAATANPGANAL
ncbi:type IV pilus biogenesis/stability protein PilW [Xanthomonas arboricola pv. populi]|uniref:Type IV pilus biogenesis/stability protein PilW n=1 Tax=Xanthomonas arboricola pv. populi TaxID=487823 RepID=A0A2S6Z9M2_9XANT|nr:tetratricopeptide repeat protein [Xanthomonas arboricola]PPT78735.1 type IV pilus biogenesis/stability protein PilW [Xanthomonas arboricola pv. populi]